MPIKFRLCIAIEVTASFLDADAPRAETPRPFLRFAAR
jgi:hypothetical protein